MRHFIRFLLLLIITSNISAQSFKPVDESSKIHFTIRNFGINTGGDLSGIKGSITFTPGNPANCNFNVSVDVRTIDTDNGGRDKHLKSDDYFDTEKYPTINIRSTKIDKAGDAYSFTGTLTMHGVTKTISFPFTATMQNNDCLFKGEFEINRLDYGVGKSSGVLSNTVKISLSVLAKKG